DRTQGLALAVGSGNAAQIKNGIANQLAGAMEGNVPAAVAFEYLHAPMGEQFGRRNDILPAGIAAKSNHGRMFEEEEDVTDAAFLAQFDQAPLQAQAGGVVHGAELEDGDQEILCHGLSRISTDQKQLKDLSV